MSAPPRRLRVLLVFNKPNRELPILDAIRREVLALAPDARVEVGELVAPGFNRFAMTFRPHVILTYPFTCVAFSRWFYVFKLLLGCRVICLRAEGVVDLSSEQSIEWATGYDTYGPRLVDQELFWGRAVADAIGRNLLRQGKLDSLDRVRVVGYVRFESYFDPAAPRPALPERLRDRLEGRRPEDVVLLVTGFHLANYTSEDLVNAGDLDAERRLDDLLRMVAATARLRGAWIDAVRRAAAAHPHLLFVLKKHPIELPVDYDALETEQNVVVVREDVEVQDLIRRCGLLVHYGSTTLADAYLAGVPSVFVTSEDARAAGFSDLGWPSTVRCDVSALPATIARHAEVRTPFERTAEVDRVLSEVFAIEPGQPYRPAREIARLLVSDEAPLSTWSDPHLWRALVAVGARSVRGRLHRLEALARRCAPLRAAAGGRDA